MGLAVETSSKALEPTKITIYFGTLVHTPLLGELEALPSCGVLVDKDGTITDIEKNCDSPEALIAKHKLDSSKVEIIDISANPYQFFFPGFVDTHIHAPQFPNAGIFGNSTLLDWLNIYTFPLEASFANTAKAKIVYTQVVKHTLFNGTTTASYFATIHPEATKQLANLCFNKGQRALIGRVCMDANSPEYYVENPQQVKENTLSVNKHISELGEVQKKLLNDQVTNPENTPPVVLTTLTPRFAPSCSAESLKWLGELRERYNLHVQTHVSENQQEIEWVAELFPDSKNYTSVYEDFNLLSSKTVLAHGVHLTENEKNVIKKHDSGVSHCPISNSSLTSGETRVRWLLDSGVKVGLGTDMSGGFSPSILSSARQALLVSRHLAMKTSDSDKLSVAEVLYLGTVGGARCLDLQEIIGDFQIGKKWEAQLVDLKSKGSPIDVFDWQLPNYLIQRNNYYLVTEKQYGQNLELLRDMLPATFDKTVDWLVRDVGFDDLDKLKFDDLVAKWVFNGDDRNTVKVWVNGRCVLNKLNE